MNEKEIICAGEILWDSMPAGLFLGGAPFNVAHDLHCLGLNVRVLSRVGKDTLGNEIVRRLEREGMSSGLLQFDNLLPTGFVEVLFDKGGEPSYRIVKPVAWDAIVLLEGLEDTVTQAGMLIFGTLACRSPGTLETIRTLISKAPLKVLDINLRPGAQSPDIVDELLHSANIVKMNLSELGQVRSWFGLSRNDSDAVEEIVKRFDCSLVAVSKGRSGGSLWHRGNWTHHPGFKVQVKNSVGAGDAFLAGLTRSVLESRSDEEIIESANLMGAYVATKEEAAPPIVPAELEAIRRRVNS